MTDPTTPPTVPAPTHDVQPLPKMALRAWALLREKFQREANELAADIDQFAANEGWTIHLDEGVARRPIVPPVAPAVPPAETPPA